MSPELCALALTHSLCTPEASVKNNSTLTPPGHSEYRKNNRLKVLPGSSRTSKSELFLQYSRHRTTQTLKKQPILLLSCEKVLSQCAEICAPLPTPIASHSFKKKRIHISSFSLLHNSSSNIYRIFS